MMIIALTLLMQTVIYPDDVMENKNIVSLPKSREEKEALTQEVIVTFYTKNDENMDGSGVTASGTIATEGRTIAMDESIPFGTKILIDNQEFIVEDRGGAIKGNRVDMFVNDVEYAFTMGKQRKTIIIKEEE